MGERSKGAVQRLLKRSWWDAQHGPGHLITPHLDHFESLPPSRPRWWPELVAEDAYELAGELGTVQGATNRPSDDMMYPGGVPRKSVSGVVGNV